MTDKYNALDVDRAIEECQRMLVLEHEDLIYTRNYEGALEMADYNEFEEEHGYPPFDPDEYYAQGWRGDARLAALQKAIDTLATLRNEQRP